MRARNQSMDSAYQSDMNDADEEVLDYRENSDLYFSNLHNLTQYARKLRQNEIEEEKKLFEYLPVSEKFSFNKEGKVLARWKQRQRDWEKIQQNINKTITRNSKSSHGSRPLMMATSDEFRAKMEEYDLIQASIPVKDKYSDSSWQMTLRGGGPIRVAIGHIFSGLECEVDPIISPPKMVRKPKLAPSIGKNDTFIEPSETLLQKRKKYGKTMTEYRPHTLTYSEASSLLIRSEDLFDWAKQSSEAYLNRLKYLNETKELTFEATEEIKETEILKKSEKIVPKKVKTLKDLTLNAEALSATEPSIQILSSPEVIFSINEGETQIKKFNFKNTGLSAVHYKWEKVKTLSFDSQSTVKKNSSSAGLPESCSPKKFNSNIGNEVETFLSEVYEIGAVVPPSKNILIAKEPRERQIGRLRQYFQCLETDGGERIILPGEEVSSTFSFTSRSGGGLFQELWKISFTPEDTLVFIAEESDLKPRYGSLNIFLRGHCLKKDESHHKRKEVKEVLEHNASLSLAKDIVNECIRRVRKPVRRKDLLDRQIQYFKTLNKPLIDKLKGPNGDDFDIYLNDDRLQNFIQLSAECSSFYQELVGHRQEVIYQLQDYSNRLEELNSSFPDPNAYQISTDPFLISLRDRNLIQSIFFPEALIEVFDEITEESIIPQWDYDLSGLFAGTSLLLQMVQEIDSLQKDLDMKTKAYEKIKRKEERALARRRNNEEDDDDDEEEDDEEDEEEDEEEAEEDPNDPPLQPKSQYGLRVDEIQNRSKACFKLLVTQPLDTSDLYDCVRSALVNVLDQMESFQEKALTSSKLLEMHQNGVEVPKLPSPFSSEEGAEAWSKALKRTSPDSETAPTKGKGGGHKNAPLPTEATPEQGEFYYKELYNQIHSSLLDASMEAFSAINERCVKELIEKEEIAHPGLYELAVFRPLEDLGGRPESSAILNFDFQSYIKEQNPVSAFEKSLTSRQSKLTQTLLDAVRCEPNLLLLVSDKSPEEVSYLPAFQSIKEQLTHAYEAYKTENDKLLKKSKVPKREYKQLDMIFCKTVPELNLYLSLIAKVYHLASVSSSNELGEGDSVQLHTQYLQQFIPVLVCENLNFPGVIPAEPAFEEVESDDDEAPIGVAPELGSEERHKKWLQARPHRVEVSQTLDSGKDALDKDNMRHLFLATTTSTKPFVYTEIVGCYTLSKAAVLEECFRSIHSISSSVLLIDTIQSSFLSTSNLFAQVESKFSMKCVSDTLREHAVWADVVRKIVFAQGALSRVRQQNAQSEDPVEGNLPEPNLMDLHLGQQIFRPLLDSNLEVRPTSILLLGGEARMDKFRVLDRLIAMVDEVHIFGEMCLPFLVANPSFVFLRYQEHRESIELVRHIICKARVHNCRICLPEDLMVGDEPLKEGDRLKPYRSIDPDSRAEGFDYEGEVKVLSLKSPEDKKTEPISARSLVKEPNLIKEFVYDIGPSTAKKISALKDIEHAILLSWGTPGLCESSNFQEGQQALVAAINLKEDAKEATDVNLSNDGLVRRSILVGESNVEWSSRLIDPDGEAEGDLVANGNVSFVSRSSDVFARILGEYESFVSTFTTQCSARPPNENEWVYSRRVIIHSDDEEEEDDEEED